MSQVLATPDTGTCSHDAPAALCDGAQRRPATLREAIKEACAVRRYSRRTFDAYWHWARQFVLWSGRRPVRQLGKADVEQFLTWLATERQVAASTQRQALAALLFMFQHVLQAGTDIRTIQELLGHNDVETTMIYTHVLGAAAGRGVRSPLDALT